MGALFLDELVQGLDTWSVYALGEFLVSHEFLVIVATKPIVRVRTMMQSQMKVTSDI